MTSSARPLTATYRLQMNAHFTFAHARAQLEYFASLGISHLYLSPILTARRGSMHGYDVVDPTRIDPELGGEPELRALADEAHARGIGLIVDIVPNHMGIGSENVYWDDVLTHGERSPYARWFDIDWSPRADGHRKLILPVLGDELDRVLARGELSMRVREGETPRIVYFNQSFPVDPAALPPELQLTTLDVEEAGELVQLYSGKAGADRLRELLDVQHYRLVFWRRGSTEINYRRFFDVDDLVALRVEDEQVFHATHKLIVQLVADDVIDGLRVDHIDGLLDPDAYLKRLRASVRADTPIFVEKILSQGEQLRSSWPVQGTTGYEFMNDIEDVFVDPNGFREIEERYRRLRHLAGSRFADAARAGKRSVLEGPLRADVDRLVRRLTPIARAAGKRWTAAELTAGVIDLIVALPAYRTYITDQSYLADDAQLIERALTKLTNPADEVAAFVAASLKTHPLFAERLQQISGPATAKGVEDTALYQYVPLVSINEVGGGPDRPLAHSVARFHDANAHRNVSWPLSLTATNTHDTKRSADLRARVDTLSEIAPEWERSLHRWRRLNAKHRRTVGGRLAPDTNTEYLIYQTLIGLWPAPRAGRRSDDIPDRAWRLAARDRLLAYLIKAAREAKTRTSWTDPSSPYEEALESFLTAILEPSDEAPFLVDVARLVSSVATIGAWNSLSRIVLHLMSPGTPDTYQGDEFWNYTLVDPDNRRSVDYGARALALHTLDALPPDPFENRFKLFVVRRLLALRRERVDLFVRGHYIPLTVRGARAANVVAFARTLNEHHVITIAPRLVGEWFASGRTASWWADTEVLLPSEIAAENSRSKLTDQAFPATEGKLQVARVLHTIPVAVLGS